MAYVRKTTDEEFDRIRRENCSKGRRFGSGQDASECGKASQRKQKLYKNFKTIAREILDEEEQKKILDSLIRSAKHGGVNSTKLLLQILGELEKENSTEVVINNTVKNPFENLTEEELRKLIDK